MARADTHLKVRWQAWSERFAALLPREKTMILGAVAVAILFGGYSLWVEPGQLQVTRLKKAIAQQQNELGQLSAQIVVMAGQNTDPDAGTRVQLQQVRDQLGAATHDLQAFDGTLVAPAQASALLQTLLARHRGLSLVSLTTLPPQPLIERMAKKKDGEKPEAGKDSTKDSAKKSAQEDTLGTRDTHDTLAMPGGNIYKHGIEIKLAGSYQDLLDYVAELEASPQKLLWGSMQLTVKQHPVSELTLTIYTLSLDSIWLVV